MRIQSMLNVNLNSKPSLLVSALSFSYQIKISKSNNGLWTQSFLIIKSKNCLQHINQCCFYNSQSNCCQTMPDIGDLNVSLIPNYQDLFHQVVTISSKLDLDLRSGSPKGHHAANAEYRRIKIPIPKNINPSQTTTTSTNWFRANWYSFRITPLHLRHVKCHRIITLPL